MTSKAHGRIEERQLSVYTIEPTEVELAHARSLIIVHKTTTSLGKNRQSTQYKIGFTSQLIDKSPPK